MGTLEHLGLALGLASLAGINLYLTVAITGLALRFDLLDLATKHQQLEALGHPAIITVALVLFCLEFFADKIPWVDSLWDSVHTFVRPAGAVLIALPALGALDPTVEVIGALVAGIAAATMHGAKASTRLIVNASPEPFSNSVVSVAEDVAVVGLWALVATHPAIAFWVFLGILVALWFVMPRLLRIMRANAWLMWNKLRLPGSSDIAKNGALPDKVSAEEDMLVSAQLSPARYTVAWAAPTLTGGDKKMAGTPSNVFGKLVAFDDHPEKLVFVGRGWFKKFAHTVAIDGCQVSHESKFLSENLTVYNPETKAQATFRFKRGDSDLVDQLMEALRKRGASQLPEHAASASSTVTSSASASTTEATEALKETETEASAKDPALAET